MDIVQRIITARHQPGALLPILHDIQHALGFVPDDAVPLIAKELNLSRAEVHGVITYYHHFRQTPPGKHVVQVCCAEACQANGSEALAEHAAATLARWRYHSGASLLFGFVCYRPRHPD